MTDPIYKAGVRFIISNKDAAVLGPAWEKLEKRLKRPPTADDLVAEASKPTSAFHPYFEWDPVKQQAIYLRNQARAIIGSLDVILPDRDNQRVRGIIPLLDGSGGYMSTVKALAERPDVIDAQIVRAKHDARAYYERYEGWIKFREFAPAVDVMEAARRFAYDETA